jgi:DNA-binding response OmpR family regulator
MPMRALVATGNQFLSSFFEKKLGNEGFIVDKATAGDSLQSVLKTRLYDIIFAHVNIGGTSGFDVCRELKSSSETKDIPIVLMSGEPEDELKAAEARADIFLGIPFDETLLMDIIMKLIRKKSCILMVDDSKVIHARTGKFLVEQGFHVLHAFDGEEGIETAKREKPDIIISDVEMPRMDGYQMCKEIKRCPETSLIPVIIVSSLDQGINIDKGFVAGANDYLIKPVVHSELLSCVNNILQTIKLRRQETIMIVDSDDNVINLLKFGLLQQGFHVVACADGEAAYEKAIEHLPDVIIADMDTPKLDGYQLVKYLKERKDTANIPVIIIASRESRSELAKGLRIGAAAFITKPFSIDKIIVNVERLTVERRFTRERETMKLYLSEAAIEAVEKSSMKKEVANEFQAMEKSLTILFSDIVGFTTFCEKLKPSEIVSYLNSYLDVMTTVLKDHGAVIDKFIGDAILAIFGTDTSGEAPQFRAVKAAQEMLRKQAGFNEKCAMKFQTRIGINSGPVIFGDIGSRYYRRDFTVIGDPVNTAQRLQTMAAPDSTLISDTVYQSVKDLIRVEGAGLLSLKGKDTKIMTYKVLGIL